MDDSRNCVLVAKKEYTTVLVYKLYPAIYQGLKSIWNDAKRTAKPRDVCAEFQARLSRVRKWNQEVIDNEYRRILDKSQCEWLDELIKRVFVINTQILAAVNMHQIDPNKKIKVKVPKGDKFIHCCYKECARAFFENVLLMEDRSISRVEQSKNLQKAYKLIMTCIENTIRNLLPLESLLKDNMDDNVEGEDATPPAMLFQNFSQFNNDFNGQKRKDNLPLSSFPTLTSVLEQPHQIDKHETPTLESLQPSMNDFSTTPMPDADSAINHSIPLNIHMDVNLNPTTKNDTDDNEDDEREREREREREKELEREREEEEERERDREREREKEKEDEPDIRKLFEPATKTIFLKSYTPEKRRKRDTSDVINTNKDDNQSDDSDNDNIRNKDHDDLDNATEDMPIVRKSIKKSLDLDVSSANEELPIRPTIFDTEDNSYSRDKMKLPPLEGVDSSENFFSDAE